MAAVAGSREGAPFLMFSLLLHLASGIIGSTHLSEPQGLHLWFALTYFFPMAKAAWTWPETTCYPCVIKIQFCLNCWDESCLSSTVLTINTLSALPVWELGPYFQKANSKIIVKMDWCDDQSWRNGECSQSYTPLTQIQVIILQVMARSAG